jgi:hypothetical protein
MLTRIEEKKIDGKRCVVVSMEIDENATKVTEKGNITYAKLGGNVTTNIMVHGQPLQCNGFAFAKAPTD